MLNFASPFFQCIAFYGFFIFGALFFRITNGLDNYINPRLVWQAAFDNLVTFFIAFFIFFFLWISRNQFRIRKAVYFENTETSFHRNKIILLLFSSLLILVVIGVIKGANPIQNPLQFRQAIQSSGNAYFFLYYLFSMKLFGVYFFNSFHNRTLTLIDYVILTIVVVFSFLSGFSSLFAYVFLAGFIFLNARYGVRILNIKTIFGFMALIVLAPIYNFYRMLKLNGIEVNFVDFTKYLETFKGNFWLTIWDRFDYFQNFVQGAETARIHTNFFKIFDFILQPIPRAFFPEKAFNFSTMMTSWVYPKNVLMGVTANFGFLNEFILYFNDAGPMVAGVFLGFLFLWMFSSFIKARKSNFNAAKYDLVILPYFGGLAAGYYNDFALPTLILNFVFWHIALKIKAIK